MTEAADLILTNAEVHTLAEPDRTYEAVAIRDGCIVRVTSDYEVDFLAGVETETIDLEGRVVLPGFIDAHTHLPEVGRRLVHADLSDADSRGEALDRLRDRAAELAASNGEESGNGDEWVLGFGYDESTWDDSEYLTRGELDAVSEARPVLAVREDMHVASGNSVVLDRYREEMPAGDVRTESGVPTGVLVEDALGVVWERIEPDAAEMRDLLTAAQHDANQRGVTGVHDMVRQSRAPEVYRDLDLDDELTLRVRLNYWSDHLDALLETGLRTDHGSEMVQVGGVKTFTDGSLGGRTAKLSEPYDDAPGESGQWVVDPDELEAIVTRADEAGLQVTVHAIGDVAIEMTLDVLAGCDDPAGSRHRVEHAELADDVAIERFADLGVVASMQPNFHKWAQKGGLYASRLGDRRTETNRLGAFADAGAHLAFGSDCMPLDPLLGIHHAVNAPTPEQRLDVTDALRAYTSGAAYAGFDEDRLGTIEAGKCADLVVLERSPWEHSDDIQNIDVAMTLVDGEIVYDRT